MANAFDVKVPAMLTDPVSGYPNLHSDAAAMLDFVCGVCSTLGIPRPLVTEFGRTRNDMETIYVPTYVQAGTSLDMAKALARARFSWHCIPTDPPDKIRAFDLRDWLYTDAQRSQIMVAVQDAYAKVAIELLDHAVPGGARHFHFGIPNPAGKPKDWK